jgi:hypothetical protein
MSGIGSKKEAKSPIRKKPLPLPGASLRAAAIDVIAESTFLVGLGIGMLALVVHAWLAYLMPTTGKPILISVVAGVVVVVACIKFRRFWPALDNLGLGIDGERSVAETLDTLRKAGYRIYHDLQEDGYNIDHVVIGPAGIFAIETKTRRKRGDQKVIFDGATILVGGHKPDRDPIAQAQASARRVRDILKEQTGKDYWVKPVVLFPGWFVVVRKWVSDLFVGNEKLFLSSFHYEHAQARFSPEEVADLSAAMERHLRRV